MADHDFIAGIPLVLGGNVFGWSSKGDEAFAVLDAFYEAGGRMIDTADVYSAWVPGHKGGESEAEIGRWLESRGVRDEMRLHTKTGMLGGSELYEPATVLGSLDASLERLRTDRVDLYYAHKDYPELDIGQIVEAFDGAVQSGKAVAVGASNFDAARLEAALDQANKDGAAGFAALQNEYNLVARQAYGADLQHLVADRGLAMLPFFGLASGYLTGKYRTDEDFAKSVRGSRARQLAGTNGPAVIAAMDAVAAETGASLAAIALAWLVRQPGIPAPIASARTKGQLDELLEFTRVELSDDQLARLTAAA
ncbi:L-glyceraldehyde 3-phosphate reductase [Tsuneonella dongtanensis]|uniref:L-glyceraldehyde 3-phosphate reductase n=1 Tax=Tsuneonella dongtanensis TaxID=692370 RepID=A0A1B2AEY5_9SPHN|nr:aldo/keto reductase [Tsuneonella dongtanensis]ANY20648.1 L-glyceraldehyde 3-phosphate reductase [Tsuneonella dongtanensis]